MIDRLETMHCLEGADADEIATALGLTVGAVVSQISTLGLRRTPQAVLARRQRGQGSAKWTIARRADLKRRYSVLGEPIAVISAAFDVSPKAVQSQVGLLGLRRPVRSRPPLPSGPRGRPSV
jgi:hypothetical protein